MVYTGDLTLSVAASRDQVRLLTVAWRMPALMPRIAGRQDLRTASHTGVCTNDLGLPRSWRARLPLRVSFVGTLTLISPRNH